MSLPSTFKKFARALAPVSVIGAVAVVAVAAFFNFTVHPSPPRTEPRTTAGIVIEVKIMEPDSDVFVGRSVLIRHMNGTTEQRINTSRWSRIVVGECYWTQIGSSAPVSPGGRCGPV